jgi:hypothetical protein
MKNPDDLLELEPLEGWGIVNAMACAYIAFFTPFIMAGFTARSDWIGFIFYILTTLAVIVLTVDMSSRWIVDLLRDGSGIRRQEPSSMGSDMHDPDATAYSTNVIVKWVKRKVHRALFPIEYRVKKFLRGLKMERWSNWKFMDATVLVSFVLQYSSFWMNVAWFEPRRGRAPAWSVPLSPGVHWTYSFGLLRLVAGSRVLHFISCAENNLMLRRRMTSEERHYIRICKLTLVMSVMIHLSACLWVIIARIELGPHEINPQPTPFFSSTELYLGRSGLVNSYLHAVHWAWVNLAGIGSIDSVPETSLECVTTLLIHLCGATLYAVITGNVVTILEVMSERQLTVGNDLAESKFSVCW